MFFTASKALIGKLERLGALLSHSVAANDVPTLVEQAIDLAIAHHEKRRFGAKKSRKAKATTAARHVPAGVRRAVYDRDGGHCTYVAADGTRCESAHHVQLDHIWPVAMGGASTVENLRLLCRAHNLRHAEGCFGADAVRRRA